VSVTITNDDPALSLALVGGGEQQQRQMEDRVEGASQERRPPPRRELSHAKEQVAPPADLLAEQDDREDDRGDGEAENAAAEAGTQAGKSDHPESGRDAKAQGNYGRRP
jgi:hypothetical protein